MLDLRTVRDDPEGVKAALAKRGPGAAELVDRLLTADAVRRQLVTEVDALRADQKGRGKEVARAASPEERERLLAGLKELSARLDEAVERLRAADAELAALQAAVREGRPDTATALARWASASRDLESALAARQRASLFNPAALQRATNRRLPRKTS